MRTGGVKSIRDPNQIQITNSWGWGNTSMPVKDYPITEKMKTSIIIDKPESKSQVQAQRGKEEFGLRAVT